MTFQRLSIAAACLALVFSIAGCPGGGTVAPTRNQSGKTGEQNELSPDDLLKSAVHQLRPEVYNIAVAVDKPVNLLNSWRGLVDDKNAPDKPPIIPSGWIGEADTARLDIRNYDLRDAVHVRDAILMHIISANVMARGGDEIAQIQGLFDYVVRNVSLRGPDEVDIPLGIYQVLLIGRGAAEDRAWLLSALLRQLRIDSVIVRPSADSGADGDPWLFGAILNGHVHLFDPRLGIAIPSSTELAKPGPPATLDAIHAHPEWLQPLALRADQPYAIEAEFLRQPRIAPIVETDFWNRRMKHLESYLPAEDVCVLYDPLFDEADRPGLFARLAQVNSQWTAEKLKPWAYPLQQFEASRTVTPAMQQALEAATITFGLPIPVHVNPETNKVTIGSPEKLMLKIRTDQLLGKYEDATKRFLAIRQLAIEDVPVPNLAVLNQLGAEYAMYWTGVCKFEVREYEAAMEQLSTYVKRYDRNGRWNFAARALLAECHAELGNFKAAAALLEATRSDDPNRAANAIRAKRWNAMK